MVSVPFHRQVLVYIEGDKPQAHRGKDHHGCPRGQALYEAFAVVVYFNGHLDALRGAWSLQIQRCSSF